MHRAAEGWPLGRALQLSTELGPVTECMRVLLSFLPSCAAPAGGVFVRGAAFVSVNVPRLPYPPGMHTQESWDMSPGADDCTRGDGDGQGYLRRDWLKGKAGTGCAGCMAALAALTALAALAALAHSRAACTRCTRCAGCTGRPARTG